MAKTRSAEWSKYLQRYEDYFPTKALPTKCDVILEYLKRKSELNTSEKGKFNLIKNEITDKLISIYKTVPQATIQRKSVENKLKSLISQYEKMIKNAVDSQIMINYRQQLLSLFNISYCMCQMKKDFVKDLMSCNCPTEFRILKSEYDFMYDQRGARKMVISTEVDHELTHQYQATQLRRLQVKNQTENDNISDSFQSSSSNYVPATRTRKIETSYQDMDSQDIDDSDKSFEPDLIPSPSGVKKVKLLDKTQCHTADKKAISNRGLATVIKNDARKINEESPSNLQVKSSSKSTIHRQRLKCREEHLVKMEKALADARGPLQIMFDGKKINGRERMVVVLQYINEDGERCQDFFRMKSFNDDDTISGECLFNAMVKELFNDSLLSKVICSMSDTTAVNTGARKGINARLRTYFKKSLGKDLHTFECLLHVNELYLTHFIKFYEGDTKAPNKMQEDSIYNLIQDLKPEDLGETNIPNFKNISVNNPASTIISKAIDLASTWKKEKKASVFRDDHLRMLVLAAKLYRSIPENLNQYLFHRQETMSQSRWCTTASGYLRIYIFDVFDFDKHQCEKLQAIVSFILNVYVPIFVQTNLYPRIPNGPDNVIFARDLMMSFGVPDTVKNIFLNHAEQWLSPVNAAVVVHQETPPISLEDLKKIRVMSVKTRDLCWSSKKIKSFLTIESALAPCVSVGSGEFWRSVDNNNRTCERYIGKMGLVFKNGWVKDSGNSTIDSRVRGYVLNMEKEASEN